MKKKYEYFEYDFDMELPVGRPDYWSGSVNYERETIHVNYPAMIEDVKSCLYKLLDGIEMTEDVLEKYIDDNYDKLVDENYDYLKNYFEEDAKDWSF